MKRILLVLAIFASLIFAANHEENTTKSQEINHSKMNHNASKAEAITATGIIKAISKDKKSATIAHEAIPQIKWPAMTMDLPLNDAKLVGNIQVNDSVNFELTKTGKTDYVITKIYKK